MQFKFVFGASELDERNWVVDFGGLKPKHGLKIHLTAKVVLDEKDHSCIHFETLEQAKLAELTILDGVGVEMFAYHAWKFANDFVKEMTEGRCWCESAECAEHGANSALYIQTQKVTFSE